MHIRNISSKARAFINHKPFHPGNFANLETVWKAEEDLRERDRQAAQRSRMIEEEQRVESLRGKLRQFEHRTAVDSRAKHGLEWMYDNPVEQAAERPRTEPTPVRKAQGPLGDRGAIPEGDIGVTDDELRKLREDPLLAINLANKQGRHLWGTGCPSERRGHMEHRKLNAMEERKECLLREIAGVRRRLAAAERERDRLTYDVQRRGARQRDRFDRSGRR